MSESAPPPTLEGINHRTLRDQVLGSLRQALFSGSLAPGSRLLETELAEQLSVSRGTVREALRRLQQSGLVEGEDRTGLRVRARLRPDEVQELFEVRAVLEELAITLVMASPNVDEIVASLASKVEAIPNEGDYLTRIDADLRFHEEMCLASGNALLVTHWRQLEDLMRVAVLVGPTAMNDDLITADFHRPIIKAMRGGEAETARAVLRDHMGSAAKRWEDVARQG
jgi:DNA-binding GntR family transcriptional regulator